MLKFYSHLDFGGTDSSRHLFKRAGWKPTENPDEADVIVFNGGADIGTEIYGEVPCLRGIPHLCSSRDLIEVGLYKEFRDTKAVKLGICRGAQLLNCLNGGTLWQHVNNHQHDHLMVDLPTGKVFKVTSTHHQMMRPNLEDGILIGVSSESTVKHAQDLVETFVPTDNLTKSSADVEVVHYPKTNTLCVQGHPEYVPGSAFAEYVLNMVVNLHNGDELSKPREVAA